MLENAINGLGNHKSHSQAINGNTQNEDLYDKSIPCDALDCDAEASEKIELSAGIYGTIHINVCKNCIGIFKRGENQL